MVFLSPLLYLLLSVLPAEMFLQSFLMEWALTPCQPHFTVTIKLGIATEAKMAAIQGNLFRGIDEKTVRREGISI